MNFVQNKLNKEIWVRSNSGQNIYNDVRVIIYCPSKLLTPEPQSLTMFA